MALFTIQGITQAIENLNCQPNTLRARLLERIRASYTANEDLDTLKNINTEELITELWDVHSPEEIKQKRKNFSGLKSSVNKALKTALADGGNPDGIIISRDNIFTVSEEKKNSLIEKLGVLGGKESIADILGAVKELIKDSISHESDINNLMQQLDSTKEILSNLAGKEITPALENTTNFEEEPLKAAEEDNDSSDNDAEFEEVDGEDLLEAEEDGDEEEFSEVAGDETGEAENEDDWNTFDSEDDFEVIEDDDSSADDDEFEEVDDEYLVEVGKEEPLGKSLDISQYIEAKEALNMGDILQESNEEYVKQILDRFMPQFIKIPAGTYPIGTPKKRNSDRSVSTTTLPSFFIGQHPITNDIFDFFVRETGYVTSAEKKGYGLVTNNRLHGETDKDTGRAILIINQGITTVQVPGANWMHPCGPGSSLENKGNHPVVQVSMSDAMAFASWAGKKLPTEDEWEVAARGDEGFLYPWGNKYEPLANLTESQHGTTSKVGLYGRLSLSPFGLLDMIGNVAEWTSSFHDKKHNLIITKGGSWASERATSAQRTIESKDTWTNTIGFRCCVNSPEE